MRANSSFLPPDFLSGAAAVEHFVNVCLECNTLLALQFKPVPSNHYVEHSGPKQTQPKTFHPVVSGVWWGASVSMLSM